MNDTLPAATEASKEPVDVPRPSAHPNPACRSHDSDDVAGGRLAPDISECHSLDDCVLARLAHDCGCERQPAWMPLLICIAVLLAKCSYWSLSLIGFAVVAALVLAGHATKLLAVEVRSGFRWVSVLALWVVWVLVVLQGRAMSTCGHPVPFVPSRSVVCIGDSLTSGLLPDRGYPAQLQELIQLPVVNLGQSGITTEGALERLAKVATVDPPPQVVIIELGGHDFLKGWARATTKANLEQMIDACRAMGAEVVLIEVPRGFMIDPFRGLERQIAAERDVELVADSAIRQWVLWSPISPPGMWFPKLRLSDDGIHSNPRGSAHLARQVADALERMYGPQIRK